MAAERKQERLLPKQIVCLAAKISAHNMASIAIAYMGINQETVKNIRHDNSNSEAFNREIIQTWANKTSGNQIQVKFYLFFVTRRLNKIHKNQQYFEIFLNNMKA